MATLLAVGIVLVMLATTGAVQNPGKDCIQTFNDLVKSFQSRPANIDSVRRAILPPGDVSNVHIHVYYHFTATIMHFCNSTSGNLEDCEVDLENVPYDYKFRWSSTSVHGFIGPKLLERLSLYVYQTEITEAHVVIDPICSKNSSRVNRTEVCQELTETDIASPSLEMQLLNELTCLLKPYTLGWQSIYVDLERTRGYSTVFFSCTSEDYQVIGHHEDYRKIRLTLEIGLICLSIVISLSTPHIVVYIYNHTEKVDEKLAKHPVFRYYVWGTVIVALKLYILIFAEDICTIIVRGFLEKSKVADVRLNYIIGIIALVLFQLLAFVSTLSLNCMNHKHFWNNFPVIDNIVSCCHCNRKVVLLGGIYIFTVSLNLVAAHMVYILLAIIASPITSTSLLFLFGTATFLVIAVWAIILETVNKTTRQERYKLVFCVFICFVFLGFVACFIAFAVMVHIKVEHHHKDSILATLIITVLPSLVLGFIGYLGKRMLTIMNTAAGEGAQNNEHRDQADGHPVQPQQHPPPEAQPDQPIQPEQHQLNPPRVGLRRSQSDRPLRVRLQPDQHGVGYANDGFEEVRDSVSTLELKNYESVDPVHWQTQSSPV